MSFKGDELRGIVEDALNGVEAAQSILDAAPKLDPEYNIFWNGFHELATARPVGMGLACIPITAIMDYTTFYPFTQEEAYEFVEIIRLVDNAWVRCAQAKMPKS